MDMHVDVASIWSTTSYRDECLVECAKIVGMILRDDIATIAKRASIVIQRNQSPTKRHANVSIALQSVVDMKGFVNIECHVVNIFVLNMTKKSQ
jgi:hypothetical protein